MDKGMRDSARGDDPSAWVNGGHHITNFGADELAAYEEAVRRYPGHGLYISRGTWGYSHALCCSEPFQEIGEFWRMLEGARATGKGD